MTWCMCCAISWDLCASSHVIESRGTMAEWTQLYIWLTVKQGKCLQDSLPELLWHVIMRLIIPLHTLGGKGRHGWSPISKKSWGWVCIMTNTGIHMEPIRFHMAWAGGSCEVCGTIKSSLRTRPCLGPLIVQDWLVWPGNSPYKCVNF